MSKKQRLTPDQHKALGMRLMDIRNELQHIQVVLNRHLTKPETNRLGRVVDKLDDFRCRMDDISCEYLEDTWQPNWYYPQPLPHDEKQRRRAMNWENPGVIISGWPAWHLLIDATTSLVLAGHKVALVGTVGSGKSIIMSFVRDRIPELVATDNWIPAWGGELDVIGVYPKDKATIPDDFILVEVRS